MNRAGNIPLPPEGGYVKYEPHRGWWGITPDGRIITGFKAKPSDALRDLSARVHFEHFRPRWLAGLTSYRESGV